jgi:hypothetical protein
MPRRTSRLGWKHIHRQLLDEIALLHEPPRAAGAPHLAYFRVKQLSGVAVSAPDLRKATDRAHRAASEWVPQAASATPYHRVRSFVTGDGPALPQIRPTSHG